MTDAQTQYLEPLVRSSVVTDWERKFCASLIAQTRKGRILSAAQSQTLGKIVRKFQDATMRDDDRVTE